MKQYTRDNLILFLEKVGTVLADRRFWVTAVMIVTSLGGILLPKSAVDQFGALVGKDGEAGALAARQVIEALIAVVGFLYLIKSWTVRSPSGLGTKKKPTDLEKTLKELGIENK